MAKKRQCYVDIDGTCSNFYCRDMRLNHIHSNPNLIYKVGSMWIIISFHPHIHSFLHVQVDWRVFSDKNIFDPLTLEVASFYADF